MCNSLFLKKIFLFLLLIASTLFVAGQSTYTAEFGILAGKNGNLTGDSITGFPNSLKQFRNGYNAGVKATFGTYSFFISPGLYYQEYTVKNDFTSLNPFIDSPRIRSVKAKVALGYQAYTLKRKINFRLGGGLNYNYVISIDKNVQGYDFKTIEDRYLAYNVGIDADAFFISLGLSYERSIPKILNSDIKFDFLIFSAGFNF
ncbi:MAG: hypothetical protein ACM3PT_01270 [Deltaproteobacteria bacterium]